LLKLPLCVHIKQYSGTTEWNAFFVLVYHTVVQNWHKI